MFILETYWDVSETQSGPCLPQIFLSNRPAKLVHQMCVVLFKTAKAGGEMLFATVL